MSIKYRYFPFLGFRTFDDEYKDLYGIPRNFVVKAFMFEWLSLSMIIVAKAYQEKNNNNGN